VKQSQPKALLLLTFLTKKKRETESDKSKGKTSKQDDEILTSNRSPIKHKSAVGTSDETSSGSSFILNNKINDKDSNKGSRKTPTRSDAITLNGTNAPIVSKKYKIQTNEIEKKGENDNQSKRKKVRTATFNPETSVKKKTVTVRRKDEEFSHPEKKHRKNQEAQAVYGRMRMDEYS